jgi:hypothetical protein
MPNPQNPALRDELRRLKADLPLAIKRNDDAARAVLASPDDAALARRSQIACEKVNAMRRRIEDIEHT